MPGTRIKATRRSEEKELPAWLERFQTTLLELIQTKIDRSTKQLRTNIEADIQRSVDNIQEYIKGIESTTSDVSTASRE